MTKYLNPVVLDKGLLYLIAHTSRLVVLAAAPVDYASVAALGAKAAPLITGPFASGGGRKVTLAAITNGAVTADGTVTHWALLNDPLQFLLAYGEFAAPKTVANGNAFVMPALDIVLPGLV